MTHWHIGYHTPGYLPNPDDVTCAGTDWREAFETFKDSLREYADRSDDAAHESMPDDAHDDDMPSDRAFVDSVLADDSPREGEPFYVRYEQNDGSWVAYWLDAVGDDECQHEHDDA